MTRDEALKWFNTELRPILDNNHGLFCTFYYVYDSDDPYSFTIGYQPYSCNVTLDDGETCDDCPHRTERGDCGEYYLYINEDGSISFEGDTYTEDKFNELIGEFCL